MYAATLDSFGGGINSKCNNCNRLIRHSTTHSSWTSGWHKGQEQTSLRLIITVRTWWEVLPYVWRWAQKAKTILPLPAAAHRLYYLREFWSQWLCLMIVFQWHYRYRRQKGWKYYYFFIYLKVKMCIFKNNVFFFRCVGEWVHGRPILYFIVTADEKNKKSTPAFLLLLNVNYSSVCSSLQCVLLYSPRSETAWLNPMNVSIVGNITNH